MPGSSKRGGQVFTPPYLVSAILDFCGYYGEGVLRKHVIDNSCGNGAFLAAAVRRYCQAFLAQSDNLQQLRDELQTYIHGVEIDEHACHCCLANLAATTRQQGLQHVSFDIRRADALNVADYDARMDFVVGNPPYVRVHNLAERYAQVKRFRFAQGGMTDLYLVFYELGLRMLAPSGRLCYIAPSSWLGSMAAENMRAHIRRHRNLVALVDLGHFQPFAATTYTMIALLDRQGGHEQVDYFTYNAATNRPTFVAKVTVRDMDIDGRFYLSTPGNLQWLRKILCSPMQRKAVVKNGYATLCDKVFIGDLPFKDLVIPVVKASTAEQTEAFYPYDRKGQPLTQQEIFSHKAVAEYLERNKEQLLKKSNERANPQWYLYGRTQGLLDTYRRKYAVSSIVKDVQSIKLRHCPEGTGVYGGLYILTDVDEHLLDGIIRCDEFILYIQLLKEYKSGGYYTINSKRLEAYLNYQINAHEHNRAATQQ